MSTVVLPPTPGTTVEGEPTLTAAQKRHRGMAAGDPGSPAGRIAGYAAMVLAALVFLLPLYFIVITSLKTHGDIYSNPISWIP